MAEDVVLPAAPPRYDVAITECSLLPDTVATVASPTSSNQNDSGVRPSSIVDEEARAMPVLTESRWLMDDLTAEGAENLLRMCGSNGSFFITSTDTPELFFLFCRRVSTGVTVDKVERLTIQKVDETFILEGQTPRPSLQAVAALFLHLDPHRHCPMFANRDVFVKFGRMFRRSESGWILGGDSPNPVEVPHNPMNMNDWYFPALTNEQANYMLMQHGSTNCFIVSNMGMTEHYEMSTRQSYEGVEQEIVEHLRITFDIDNSTYRIAGDTTPYPSLTALVASYRASNPHMKPLFQHPEGASNRESAHDGDDDDDDVMAPPDYHEANTLPNPDEMRRLPNVPQFTISEPGPSSGYDDPAVTPSQPRSQQPASSNAEVRHTRQSTNVHRDNKCCIIL